MAEQMTTPLSSSTLVARLRELLAADEESKKSGAMPNYRSTYLALEAAAVRALPELLDTIERLSSTQDTASQDGPITIEGSIYEGMEACLVRDGRTIAQVYKYADAVVIAALSSTQDTASQGQTVSEFVAQRYREAVEHSKKLETPDTTSQDSDEWRCVNCKFVVASPTAPDRCPECSWCKEFALIDKVPNDTGDIRAATIERCLRAIAEQRCERGTPWDNALLAAMEAVRALNQQGSER